MPPHAREWRERFIEKVDRRADDECWPWLGNVNPVTGYGLFFRGGIKNVGAHIAAIEYATGVPPPPGLAVDHVKKNGCVRRDCVNWVWHLEVVTYAENNRRNATLVCAQGHDRALHSYTPSSGKRQCRICRNERKREAYYRHKERAAHEAGN